MIGVPISEPKTPPWDKLAVLFVNTQRQGGGGTYVADGEGTTGHVFNGQLVVASLLQVSKLDIPSRRTTTHLLSEIGNGLLDSNKILAFGVTDNRSDKTLLGGDCNADVNVVAVDNGVTAVRTLNGSVDSGDILHGKHTSTGEGAHETKLHAGLLEHIVLVQFPELHQRGHVNLVESGKRSGGVLGLLQALGNTQTHTVHFDLNQKLV